MALLVGIDEAGYGPTLGPLVVGASHWIVDPQRADDDFWKLLRKGVRRAGQRSDLHLTVDDSKLVYDRKTGIASLERAVLAFLRACEMPCDTLARLLAGVGAEAGCGQPGSNPEAAAPTVGWASVPWYGDLTHCLPLDPVRSRYEGVAGRLQSAMNEADVRCVALRARVVTEDHFNRRVASTRNKAAVLIEQILSLIDEAGRRCGDGDLIVRVDRLGGRDDYRELLATSFPDRHIYVLEISDECSRYRLATKKNDWHIDFTVGGDSKHLPIALASMTAKYLREALMERFNAYWRTWLPELTPTAGYYADAQRFLAHIDPVIAKSGLAREAFVRAR